jgi:predicted amidophosphoribosyltransferase
MKTRRCIICKKKLEYNMFYCPKCLTKISKQEVYIGDEYDLILPKKKGNNDSRR